VIVLGSITINRPRRRQRHVQLHRHGRGVSPFSITTVSGSGTHTIGNSRPNTRDLHDLRIGNAGFALHGAVVHGGGVAKLGTGTATISLTIEPERTCTYTNKPARSFADYQELRVGLCDMRNTRRSPGELDAAFRRCFCVVIVPVSGSTVHHQYIPSVVRRSPLRAISRTPNVSGGYSQPDELLCAGTSPTRW